MNPPVNGTVIITEPTRINIAGSPQYLVVIKGSLPVIVNGTRTTSYTGGWVWPGSVIRLSIPRYQVLPNLTLAVVSSINVNGREYPLLGNIILAIDSPMYVNVNYRDYYTIYLMMLLTVLMVLLIMRFRGDGQGNDVITV
ncbi:hypothetical protein [Vulcanisaeta distributa]|uniref:hypothetical protein n=1 Tax=Vulcanisaeta distributa TaxID=164451 RepID=UPI0006D0599D|nr:hypothetical protein [Vulcanisaeta distributa]